jgi:lipopolysaccharide export system protein LptA
MIRFLVAALTISFLAVPAFAEKKPALDRSNEPVHIKSDQLLTDSNRKMATFTGNVAARQGELTIYSDKLVVSYSETGNGISNAEVFGNVRITQGERRAEADHGVYDAKGGKIILDGNPKVYQLNDVISGKVITYFLDEDRSEITSGSGTRVEAVIHPREKGSDGRPAKP